MFARLDISKRRACKVIYLNAPLREFKDPKFKTILDQIDKINLKINKSPGIHIVEPDIEKMLDCKRRGYSFMAPSTEARIYDTLLRKAVSELR